MDYDDKKPGNHVGNRITEHITSERGQQELRNALEKAREVYKKTGKDAWEKKKPN